MVKRSAILIDAPVSVVESVSAMVASVIGLTVAPTFGNDRSGSPTVMTVGRSGF